MEFALLETADVVYKTHTWTSTSKQITKNCFGRV